VSEGPQTPKTRYLPPFFTYLMEDCITLATPVASMTTSNP